MSANITRKLFTFDDCLRMAETGILSASERIELLAGEILLMSPIGPRHAEAVSRTYRHMTLHVSDAAIVRSQSPILLDTFAAPQPDLILALPKKDGYLSAHPGPGDILLVVEVADSSLEYDSGAKLQSYAISGVTEYWIADLQNNRLLVHSRPQGDRYQEIRELHRGDTVAPLLLPECRVPVDLLLP
jgi:Uma2 family endonuclease